MPPEHSIHASDPCMPPEHSIHASDPSIHLLTFHPRNPTLAKLLGKKPLEMIFAFYPRIYPRLSAVYRRRALPPRIAHAQRTLAILLCIPPWEFNYGSLLGKMPLEMVFAFYPRIYPRLSAVYRRRALPPRISSRLGSISKYGDPSRQIQPGKYSRAFRPGNRARELQPSKYSRAFHPCIPSMHLILAFTT